MAVLEELQGLGYRELQAEAKKYGVKASGTKAEIIERIVATAGAPVEQSLKPAARQATTSEGEEAVAPPAAAAKTPRVKVTAVAAAPNGDARTPVAPKSAGKEALLKAANTPLPKFDGTPASALKTPASAARPQHDGSSSRGKARGRGRGASKLLAWATLLAAALALGSHVVVPYWQQHGLSQRLYERAHALSPSAADRAAALLSQAHQAAAGLGAKLSQAAAPLTSAVGPSVGRAHDAAWTQWEWLRSAALDAGEAAHERLALLVDRLQGKEVSPCTGTLDAASLAALMPAGDEWADQREVLAAVWGGARAQNYKPNTMIFAHSSEEAGTQAAALLTAAAQAPDAACLLSLSGAELPGDRGALQQALAVFLSKHPKGTILLKQAEQLRPELVPVLSNLMSEQGAFEHLGQAVPTKGANVLLLARLPEALESAAAHGEAAFKPAAKAQLVQAVLALTPEDQQEVVHTQLKALRRRLDYAVPVAEPASAQAEPAA